ncbi:MAG: BrnA antitoxin family protein [Caldilineales bacterium]
MNDKNTSTPLETDWERLDRMTDEDINYSDIPPLRDEFFAKARLYVPPSKRANYVPLDSDVLTWFQEHDKEYPALINLVLRKYVEIQDARSG